jgi:hypothetical protein
MTSLAQPKMLRMESDPMLLLTKLSEALYPLRSLFALSPALSHLLAARHWLNRGLVSAVLCSNLDPEPQHQHDPAGPRCRSLQCYDPAESMYRDQFVDALADLDSPAERIIFTNNDCHGS